jgi:hypothetical protein
MNRFYTDETKHILITSINRLSGTDADCIVPMGYFLNNQYTHYYCEVLDFWANSINLQGQRVGSLDAFGLMETSYNSHNHYNGQPLIPCNNFHASRQYRHTGFRFPFIAKNFNGKNIRFAFTRGDNAYTALEFTGIRNWFVSLAVTPIKNDKQPIYYISNKKYESFMYSFSSVNLVSGNITNCKIDIPAIHDGYSEYFVDVKTIEHTRQLQTLGNEFLLVYIDNWSDNDPHQFIGCLYCTGNNPLANLFSGNSSADNSIFRIKTMNKSRRINLKLISQGGINDILDTSYFLDGYTFTIHCLITPIK